MVLPTPYLTLALVLQKLERRLPETPIDLTEVALSLSLVAKRSGRSIGGIHKVIRRHKIKPRVIIGKVKYYSTKQADFIAGLIRPN